MTAVRPTLEHELVARCPRCDGPVPSDAGRCRRCGLALGDQLLLLGPATVPRRRSRWADVAGAAAVLGLLVGANAMADPGGGGDGPTAVPTTAERRTEVTDGTAVTAGTDGTDGTDPRRPPGPLLPERTGTVLVADSNLGLVAIDVDTGRSEELSVDGEPVDSYGPLAVGDGVVVIDRGTAYAVAPFRETEPVGLGPHVGPVERVLAASDPGQVWLVGHQSTTRMVRAVALDGGGATSPLHHLPPNVWPLAGVPGGLLLDASGSLVVLDSATGETSQVGDGEFVAAVGHTLVTHACDDELACGLRLTDLATGRIRGVPTPAGADSFDPWFTPTASTDGRWLLVPMRTTGFRQTAIVDLAAAAPRAEHVSYVNVAPVLSPDGRWLFELVGEGIRTGPVAGPYETLDGIDVRLRNFAISLTRPAG